MKDKELRGLLVDAGVIKERTHPEYGTWSEAVAIGEKIDALAVYLGIKFERIPERVVAKCAAKAKEAGEQQATRPAQNGLLLRMVFDSGPLRAWPRRCVQFFAPRN